MEVCRDWCACTIRLCACVFMCLWRMFWEGVVGVCTMLMGGSR